MNRSSGTCETIKKKNLNYVSSEFQKERRTRVWLKKYLKE